MKIRLLITLICLGLTPYSGQLIAQKKVYDLTHKESDVVSFDKEMQSIYPQTIKMLGQSMHALDKDFDSYIQFTAKVLTPGYKKQNVTRALIDGDIYAVSFIRYRDDFGVKTEKPLDFFLSGKNHMFTIQLGNGDIAYTYDGRFERNMDNVLVTVAHKNPVIGISGQPIQMPNGLESGITASRKGELFHDGKYFDALKITTFDSTNGLWTYEGTVFFIRNQTRTKIIPSKDYIVEQGFYEGSNEIPGLHSGTLIKPFFDATAEATQKYMNSYDKMFRAVGTER